MMIRQIFELTGLLSVVVSLAFVGFEIRQNTSAVRSATYIAISNQVIDISRDIATDERLSRLTHLMLVENIRGDELNPEELISLQMHVNAGLRRIENIYLQVQAGILDPSAFDQIAVSNYYRTNIARETWDMFGKYFDKGFISHFEALRDNVPQ
mgnify:FL=1|tara:strand:- start:921 stop:1382 length:462 start_codon:yes stop_codon:yes gene_type:complete